MNEPIPWKAPAVIAVKRKGEYHPEIGGMTLNTALEYAANPDLPASTKLCILVNWRGSEVRIEGRHIWQLAARSDRPPLPAE